MKRAINFLFLALVLISSISSALAGNIVISFSGEFQVDDSSLARQIGRSIPYYGEVTLDDNADPYLFIGQSARYPIVDYKLNLGGTQLNGVFDESDVYNVRFEVTNGSPEDGLQFFATTPNPQTVKIKSTNVGIEFAGLDVSGPSSVFSDLDIDNASLFDSTLMYFQAFLMYINVGSNTYQLLDANKQFGNLTVTVSDNTNVDDGYVVVIDGVNILSVFDPNVPPNYTQYLYDEIPSNWKRAIESRVGSVVPFEWSRNIGDTVSVVSKLSERLETLSNLAKERKAPLVVMAHSWGSALAFAAAKMNSNITIDNLITLGSPLNAQSQHIFLYTESFLSGIGVDTYISRRPGNIKSWTNYWVGCDNISGPIERLKKSRRRGGVEYWTDSAGIDNVKIPGSGLPQSCHAEYYEGSEWTDILADVLYTK